MADSTGDRALNGDKHAQPPEPPRTLIHAQKATELAARISAGESGQLSVSVVEGM